MWLRFAAMNRMCLLAVALAFVACASGNPVETFERANAAMNVDPKHALALYDEVAKSPRSSEAEKLSALLRAADACDQLKDNSCAVARLQTASALNLPGMIEPAQFQLAEHLRESDSARALSLYYMAAAGAEKFRGGGFPYKEAVFRIVQLRGKPPEPTAHSLAPSGEPGQ
jgi:hypothetical protein